MIIAVFIHTDEQSTWKGATAINQGNPKQKHSAYSIQMPSFSIPGNDTTKILSIENQVGTWLADQIMQYAGKKKKTQSF